MWEASSESRFALGIWFNLFQRLVTRAFLWEASRGSRSALGIWFNLFQRLVKHAFLVQPFFKRLVLKTKFFIYYILFI
jgi:hypothetical protein